MMDASLHNGVLLNRSFKFIKYFPYFGLAHAGQNHYTCRSLWHGAGWNSLSKILHIWPLRRNILSLAVCDWWIHNVCVFPWQAKQARGKTSEHWTRHKSCALKEDILSPFFLNSLAKPRGCPLSWECLLCDSANKLQKMWGWKKEKKGWRDLLCTWRMEELSETAWSPAPL